MTAACQPAGETCWTLKRVDPRPLSSPEVDVIRTTWVFIGTIITVFLAVTEETALDAVTVTARQKAILTQRFIGHQQRLDFALFVFQLAILDGVLPIASLLFDVKEETSWTTDCLKTL